MFTIEKRLTPRRRCGFRKPGGLYLCAPGPAAFCGKLPVELVRCPCCGQGIKPARGWTWIDATALFAGRPCSAPKCVGCPLAAGLGRAGLLWVGSCYYPTPAAWTEEANALGVCRRIAAVPKGFILGSTWVLVAHRQAVSLFTLALEPIEQRPAIFRAFRPWRLEYVVRGDETPKELESMAQKGITLCQDQRPDTAAFAFEPHGEKN